MMKKEYTLPEYLRTLRRTCRYKQDFVASQLNIARQTYSHYETGRIKPPIGALYKLAKLYGIPVENLLACAAGEKGDGSSTSGIADSSEWQLLYYFQKLDEQSREDILSMMQIKIKKQAEEEVTGKT